jgi:hypothetical protein
MPNSIESRAFLAPGSIRLTTNAASAPARQNAAATAALIADAEPPKWATAGHATPNAASGTRLSNAIENSRPWVRNRFLTLMEHLPVLSRKHERSKSRKEKLLSDQILG